MKQILALTLFSYASYASAVEVIKIGDNWTRYSYNVLNEYNYGGDLNFYYGQLEGQFWRSTLSSTVRYGCMITTNPIFVPASGEIDLSIIHDTHAFLFAYSEPELLQRPLFGYQIFNYDTNEFIAGDVTTPGSKIDWRYQMFSNGGGEEPNLYYVSTIDPINLRIDSPIDVNEGLYNVKICPILDQTDVGILDIVIDVRLGG